MYSLFVGGLPFTTSEDELNTMFSEYGTISSVKIPLTGKLIEAEVSLLSILKTTKKVKQLKLLSTVKSLVGGLFKSTKPAIDVKFF